MDRYLAVMAGAALGGAARFWMAAAITARFATRFPAGTFAVNLLGCFLIGLVSTILLERTQAHANWGLFLVTGILGGYTTFSAFGWETVQLTRSGNGMMAFAYVIASAAAGYAAVWLGILLARR